VAIIAVYVDEIRLLTDHPISQAHSSIQGESLSFCEKQELRMLRNAMFDVLLRG
jgi:hypothetical protein